MKEILVVDDNPVNLAMIEKMLECEYHVIAANSGIRALRFLEKHTADLILLDVEMPGMSGIDILGRIRALPQHRELPVILLTARKDGATVAKGFKLGILDYITKPFEEEDVLERIKRVFDQSKVSGKEEFIRE